MGPQRNIVKGDLDKAFASAKHIVEDEVKIGGQEHFYVETQVSLVVPTGEDGEMEIMCSTQDPTEAQVCDIAFVAILLLQDFKHNRSRCIDLNY